MKFKKNKSFLAMLFFVVSSALAWFYFNNQIVAAETGFDPFRYEYMAREGILFSLEESSSYTIVLLLQFLYLYLPYYIGFVIFIGVLFYLVKTISPPAFEYYALFSPFTFFYLAQTGKDGIAILALITVAIFACSPKRFWLLVVTLSICILALIIRPPLILTLLTAYAAFRYGRTKAIYVALTLACVFLYIYDKTDVLMTLEGIAGDEGSGLAAKILREYSFGYDVISMGLRCLLFFISPILQPIAALIKVLAGADAFIIFEGLCSSIFLYFLIKERMLKCFFRASIPFVIIISTVSPFYHFRYLAICYPIIMVLTFSDKWVAAIKDVKKTL
jgi:hypothetical protein